MRYLQLDFIRGVAIILMILFHLSFDLNNFHFIEIDIYNREGLHWFYFRMVIVTLFLLSVGISLALVHQDNIDYKKIFQRFITLSIASTIITIASFITFPHSWIYFGVLHFITVASLLAIPFTHSKYLSLFMGIAIITLFNLHIIDMSFLYNFFQPLFNLPKYTEDLVSFSPWFGVVLVGIFLGKERLFLFPLPINRVTKQISFIGKYSLFIYLIHQPIFFGVIFGGDYLFHR